MDVGSCSHVKWDDTAYKEEKSQDLAGNLILTHPYLYN